jgi:ammonium transporter, Amt family
MGRFALWVKVLCVVAGLSGWAQAGMGISATASDTQSCKRVVANQGQVVVDSQVLKRLADLEAYVNNQPRVNDMAHSKVAGPGPGHNGWMMICSALVLFMTLPGLALFFGGMVRTKNVLSILAQCLGITGVVTLLWWAVGYSLAFAPGNGVYGDLRWAFFQGVGAAPNLDYSAWISHNVFAMFQLMFAIITPALLIGAAAERMTFKAMMLISVLWLFLVYIPLAHMAWAVDGLFSGILNPKAVVKSIDFAGGIAVEMASGWSALGLILVLGKRRGYGKDLIAPHNLVLAMVGAGLLWVGWYGFNVGSALAADSIASNAFVATTLAAAAASIAWPGLEWLIHGKPTVLGFCSGIVGGLVAITPAAGFVDSGAAVVIGLAGGVFPFFAVTKFKLWLGYDDSLDTFGVHGVAGTVGMLLTGFFAKASINPNIAGLLNSGRSLWLEQLKAMVVVAVVGFVLTTAITWVVSKVVELRPTEEEEHEGLDLVDHGEAGYRFDEN